MASAACHRCRDTASRRLPLERLQQAADLRLHLNPVSDGLHYFIQSGAQDHAAILVTERDGQLAGVLVDTEKEHAAILRSETGDKSHTGKTPPTRNHFFIEIKEMRRQIAIQEVRTRACCNLRVWNVRC